MTGTIIIDASLLGEEQHHRRRFTLSQSSHTGSSIGRCIILIIQIQSSDNSPIYRLS
jgi:hypothetical protein